MWGAGEHRRLALDVRLDADPIEGRLYDRDGAGLDRPFCGWLGLIAAVDALRESALAAPGQCSDRGGST